MINVASTISNSKPQYKVLLRKSWEMKMPSWQIPPKIARLFQHSSSPPKLCTQTDHQHYSALTNAEGITQINARFGRLVALQVRLQLFSSLSKSRFHYPALPMSTVDLLITIRRNSR